MTPVPVLTTGRYCRMLSSADQYSLLLLSSTATYARGRMCHPDTTYY